MAATQTFLATFDDLADSTNITAANTGLASWVINGSSVGTGSANLQAKTDALVHGDRGGRFTVTGTANNYGQLTIPAGTGDYHYLEWSFTYPGSHPSALTNLGPTARDGTTDLYRPRVGTDGKFIFGNTSGTAIAASAAASAFTFGADYTVQICVKPGTGTTDGTLGVRILNTATGTTFHEWTSTAQNTSTLAPSIVRWVLPLTNSAWTTFDFDTLRLGRSVSAFDWMSAYTDIQPPDVSVTVVGPYYFIQADDAEGVTQTWALTEDTTTTGKTPLTTVAGVSLTSTASTKVWAIAADDEAADWVVSATDAADQEDTATADTPATAGSAGPRKPAATPPNNTWE